MTKLVPLDQYQDVIHRPLLDSYVIESTSRDKLKSFGQYITDQGNGIAKSMQGFKWMSTAAEKFHVAGSFTNSLGTVGREGFSALGLLYAGHCTAQIRAAIGNVWKDPTRVHFVELAYAVSEFVVSVLYAFKLFVPVCLPVDMAIGFIAPMSEISEFAVGVQQVYDSKQFAAWVQNDENEAAVKAFYKQALADQKFKNLTNVHKTDLKEQVEGASEAIKELANKWVEANGNAEVTALKNAGETGEDEAITKALQNRCIVQLKLAAEAKAAVTEEEVTDQIAKAREVYGNTGEKQVKGWLQTAKTAGSLANRILTWTLIILALTACVTTAVATPIGWTMFAIGGVSIALSMIRANWSDNLKASDNMTVGQATNAVAQVEAFKKQVECATALVV